MRMRGYHLYLMAIQVGSRVCLSRAGRQAHCKWHRTGYIDDFEFHLTLSKSGGTILRIEGGIANVRWATEKAMGSRQYSLRHLKEFPQ